MRVIKYSLFDKIKKNNFKKIIIFKTKRKWKAYTFLTFLVYTRMAFFLYMLQLHRCSAREWMMMMAAYFKVFFI
jgi:hypothetical protein